MAQTALTSAEIDDLKQLLQARQRQLKATLNAELRSDDPEQTAITAGSDGDWTTADVDADLMIASAERHAAALRDTTAALGKMTVAQYGVCERCGEAISYSRLLAYPSARHCLACQRSEEARRA